MCDREPAAQTRTILLIGGDADQLRASLADDVALIEADDVDGALRILREQQVDAVLTPATLQTPLLPSPGHAEAETILRMIGHGVCTMDLTGRLMWSNPRFQAYPEAAIHEISAAVRDMCDEFVAMHVTPERPRHLHRSVAVQSDYYFDVTGSPLFDKDGKFERTVALVWEVTANRRLQEKIDAIDRAGRELVHIDADALKEMDVGERLQLLEERIIRCSRELMHFQHFTIRLLDKKTNRIDVLLAEGMSEEAQALQIYATTDGNGISGYVAATGRSYICPDVPRDPRFLTGIENARSSLTVPLWLHDSVIGILNVESDQVGAFGEDDRQFAEIFGRYVALALNTLQLLAVERHATSGQITADVSAELSAPLNDIVTHASGIMEEYIGYDDLRKRLHEIIDAVDVAKRRIQRMARAGDVSGFVEEDGEVDPVISGKRILIADDEEVICESIAAVLSRAGAVTTMAGDGELAVRMIRAQQFDIIISDINMPHRNGYEVFATAKETHPACEVLLITGFGYDPDHSIVRASREGLAGVIFKPFKVDVLLDQVRKALSENAS